MVEITVDAELPLANGKLFRDTQGMSLETVNMLAGRGLVWLTEFSAGTKLYGGDILAGAAAEAQEVADSRGLGEIVVGPLSLAFVASCEEGQEEETVRKAIADAGLPDEPVAVKLTRH